MLRVFWPQYLQKQWFMILISMAAPESALMRATLLARPDKNCPGSEIFEILSPPGDMLLALSSQERLDVKRAANQQGELPSSRFRQEALPT